MKNPKNVQIPFDVLMDTICILEKIDKDVLSDDLRKKYNSVYDSLHDKKNRIRNRLAYADMIYAKNNEDREATLQEYIQTKELSKLGVHF